MYPKRSRGYAEEVGSLEALFRALVSLNEGDLIAGFVLCGVDPAGREIVLLRGTFVEGLEVGLRSEIGPWTIRLKALLDRGPDYDRIEFDRIS